LLPSLFEIGPVFSDKKIFSGPMFGYYGNLGWQTGSSDTILKEDHLRAIAAKFGSNWSSGFRQNNVL